MTAAYLWPLLLGLAAGLASAYPWGRWNGKRALDRAWDAGYDAGRTDGYDDALDDFASDRPDEFGQTVMLDGSIPLRAGEPRAGLSGPVPPPALAEYAPRPGMPREGGPGHLDWQERMAAELAPDALARDVPRPAGAAGRTAHDPGLATMPGSPAGPGHPDDLADELGAAAEAMLARGAESTQEWQARMNLEGARWCERVGLAHEPYWEAIA